VLDREICELCIGKDVEGSDHGLFELLSQHMPGVTEEHIENNQESWLLTPDFNLRSPEYEAGVLASLPQHLVKYVLCCSSVNLVKK
jgi:hypothetical protein